MPLEISKSVYNDVLDLFRNANEETEIEAKFQVPRYDNLTKRHLSGKVIHHFDFQRVLSYVQSEYDRDLEKENIVMDIQDNDRKMSPQQQGYRISIESMADILHYCRTNTLDFNNVGKTIFVARKTAGSRVPLTDYDILFKSSQEEMLAQKDYVALALPIMEKILASPFKSIRLKQRYNMQVSKHLRLDCTIVKAAYNTKSVAASFAKTQKPVYEIELEVLKPHTIKSPKKVLNEMLNMMLNIATVLNNEQVLMSRTEEDEIIKSYFQVAFNKPYDNKLRTTAPRKFFAAPQPVTLEYEHLHPDNAINLYHDYTVTLKADGERALLFVGHDGHMYLINNRLKIKDTRLTADIKYALSIFDCEVVMSLSQRPLILLFDAYFVQNKPVFGLHLIAKKEQDTSRIKKMEDFASHGLKREGQDEGVYHVMVKEFLYADKSSRKTIFDKVATLHAKVIAKHVDYATDGFIFTPAFLPVGALSAQDKVPESIPSGSWKAVLKWKPPQENTIDFLILKNALPMVIKNGQKNMRYDLYCGKNIMHLDNTHQFLMQKGRLFQNYSKALFDQYYMDQNVSYVDIPVDVDSGLVYAENGDEIVNESIVEMRFDTERKSWVPMRVRKDKTEQYRFTNSISGTANDYDTTVMSIWRTIINPIKIENITQKEPLKLPADLDAVKVTNNDAYYMNAQNYENRNDSPTYPMKIFHNKWIKSKLLIENFKGRVKSLYDPACGQGGDLFKWIQAEIPVVLGTDLFKSNIYNTQNGANARLANAQNKMKSDYKYVFLPYDFRLPLRRRQLQHVDQIHTDDAKLLEAIWGKNEITMPQLKRMENLARPKFDLLSCQFAAHYFFENKKTFDTFIGNVDYALKKGGYFIGTCFDGALVHQALSKNNKKMIKGTQKGDDKDILLWKIDKKYEGDFVPSDAENVFGKRIGVYIESIGQEIDEFLVSFDVLIRALQEKGIRLLHEDEYDDLGLPQVSSTKTSHGTFKDQFKALEDYMRTEDGISQDKERQKLADALRMSKEEKTLSFMYRWFVFRKD